MTSSNSDRSIERTGRVPAILGLLVCASMLLLAAACNDIEPPSKDPAQPPAAGATSTSSSSDAPAVRTTPQAGATTAPAVAGQTPQNFRVALFGDQGLNNNSRAVLELVRSEGASALFILGDFDYADNPDAWDTMLTQKLGADFPVFAVIGNHDEDRWTDYQRKLTDRLSRIQGASCTGDYGVNAACTYQGLFFVLSGAGTKGTGHAAFIRDSLAKNDAIWSVCAWHKNQKSLQVGDKSNDAGWEVYEECRKGGALVATGHEHSYERTKTLNNITNQTVDPQWPAADQVRVGGGSTFVVVSGLGGQSIRDQERCQPTTPPYGCKGEWAKVYTTNQGAKYGALFIEFYVDGDPQKARGYFKNIAGEVVDSFTIAAQPAS